MRLAIVALITLLVAPVSACPDNFIATIAAVNKSSVVPIGCGTADKSGNTLESIRVIGTGWFVTRDGYFITAEHVITALTEMSKARGCVSAIYIPLAGWGKPAASVNVRWYSFGDCITDAKLDLGVCKTANDPEKDFDYVHPLPLRESLPPDGTEVAFSGFPFAVIRPVTSRAFIASVLIADGLPLLVIDRQAWPGSSGSPVFSSDGQAVGIIIRRGEADAVGLAVARPVEAIRSFLLAHNISLPVTARRF